MHETVSTQTPLVRINKLSVHTTVLHTFNTVNGARILIDSSIVIKALSLSNPALRGSTLSTLDDLDECPFSRGKTDQGVSL